MRRLLRVLSGGRPSLTRALPPDDLWRLTSGAAGAVHSGGRAIEIERHDAGQLVLPSGRLVGCDLLVSADDAAPFDRETPAGRFPVELRIAVYAEGRDQRVACAVIRFGDGEPVAWENAAPAGLAGDFAYGVDSATGCFASPEALRAVASGAAEDAIIDALDETYVDTWSWADVVCGPNGENVVAFSTGFGDGAYPTYWGLDAAGALTVAITDFRVVDPA